MRSKPCGNSLCPKLIHERHGHGAKEFEARRYCCWDCSVAVRRAKREALAAKSKPCARPNCDKLVTARPDEGPKSYAAKKFCSTECQRLAAADQLSRGWQAKPASERRRKPCKRCNSEVVQYPNEGIKKWEQRQYCCKACSRAAREEQARVAKAPAGTRRKGNTQPRATTFARASGDAERAADRLRFHGPVWPMSTVLRPHLPPSSADTHWHVHGRVISVEEMLEKAALV
jgi:hypothetical protein